MMELAITGGKSNVTLSEAVFSAAYREALVHQVVVAWQAGGRAGTKAQKSRSDVRGSNRKPWRQKGTGRARAGSRRSPIWRSGGVTFAARPRNHAQKVNRKMYRGAMRSIFSELLRQKRLIVIKGFTVDEPRTRKMREFLDEIGVEQGLLVSAETPANIHLASRNLPGVHAVDVSDLDPVSLIRAPKVVLTVDAVNSIEEWLA